ncbi:MAG: hypothetical protein ABI718_01535 [Acidobacteriota bacterium]
MSGKNENVIEELERLDRFYDGEEPGVIPLQILRDGGLVIPEEAELHEAELHAKLWEILEAMFRVGMVLDQTDHLSDRELYRYLVDSALTEETVLSEGSGTWFLSPIGGCSEEDIQVWLRYYADEGEREDYRQDGETVPEHATLPYDRDRLLPQHSSEAIEADLQ